MNVNSSNALSLLKTLGETKTVQLKLENTSSVLLQCLHVQNVQVCGLVTIWNISLKNGCSN